MRCIELGLQAKPSNLYRGIVFVCGLLKQNKFLILYTFSANIIVITRALQLLLKNLFADVFEMIHGSIFENYNGYHFEKYTCQHSGQLYLLAVLEIAIASMLNIIGVNSFGFFVKTILTFTFTNPFCKLHLLTFWKLCLLIFQKL